MALSDVQGQPRACPRDPGRPVPRDGAPRLAPDGALRGGKNCALGMAQALVCPVERARRMREVPGLYPGGPLPPPRRASG